ncbi:MAG: hypothetical protein CBD32_06395 [Actinobacteria bacterium TMED172]|nr:hypothetical protein [Cellvibrionales bacterium]OUW32011.1 MAG: hypothetical protein CBD32_06395 [Actinobacteria bacterium TMED172]|tara:strand:- start:3251 stop:4984 length:1734 start_codon:yes stop_codon:yes gene_type:complete
MQKNTIRTLLINAHRDQYIQMARLLGDVTASDYEMTWCADYQYALEAMLAPIHDIILLDYEHAPDTCEELLRAASAHGCSTPIVCLTAKDNPDLDQAAIRGGAADYLIKDQLNTVQIERTIRYAMDRKSAESELARLAHYDALTGIPNRLLFNDRLDRALQRTDRGDSPFALLYVDLDGFKTVNDMHGHDVGDKLVQGIAERLSQCIRRTDSVARIGGDEFTVLLEKINSTNDTVMVAQKIIDVITEPFNIDGQQLRVGSSIGIAVYPEAGTDAKTLLKHADMAMYEAKAMEGSTYRFFTDQMNNEALDQGRLELELRAAINNDELAMYFQPRISLQTGKIIGAESLLRWHHPERGLLLPDEFILPAKQLGLLSSVGYWAMNRLCQDINAMDQLKLAPLRISFNVAHEQFIAPNFVTKIESILSANKVSGSRFEFELAETDVIESLAEIAADMQKLEKRGVRFSLDDFGTGFSSLPQLQRLPITTLKLDKSHVQKVVNDQDSANMVRAMIHLAHALTLKVVAEGVETESQKDFLIENNCDQMQGFIFSEPLTFDDFTKLLRQQGATSRPSYLSIVDK